MLNSVFSTADSSSIVLMEFLICAGASVITGIGSALIYMYKNRYRRDFVVTLALLPLIVQLVILLVNGNLGTGVAVMGAFSLVRFRSIPGTAKDIASIFCSMALGIATGMGYVTAAFVFLGVMAIFSIFLQTIGFGKRKEQEIKLKITVPENLNYAGLFDDIFDKYAQDRRLVKVKTTNMGSLFDLTYALTMKNGEQSKEMIDEIRCRNGNLKIVMTLDYEEEMAI